MTCPVGDGLDGVRVCVVYDCLFPWTAGGAERWYRVLSEHLAASAAQVTYLTRRQWPLSDPAVVPGVNVVAVMGEAELYLEDGTRRMGPPLRFGWGVFRWLLQHRGAVDVVHVANFPFFSLIASRVALLGTDVEIFVDWHEVWPLEFWRSYAGRLAGTLGAMIQRLGILLTPHALVFWQYNRDRLYQLGFRRDVTTLAGLLPLDRGASQLGDVPPALRPSHPVVLFAGRLIQDKGVGLLPETLELAIAREPRLRMVVVGDGPERDRLAAQFAERGLDAYVQMKGFVSDEELGALVGQASCTLVPSIREGYGLLAVESTASGTPIVVANNSENLAVNHVIDGINGFVAAPTPRGLVDRIFDVIAAGDPLRVSTREWYSARAELMSIGRSVAQVAALYRDRTKKRRVP